MRERTVTLDRNNKSILMRALHADYCALRDEGRDRTALGDLILRLGDTAPGRLVLADGEYRLAQTALNNLRSARLAAGGCTDAADAALVRLTKARACPLFFNR